MSEEVQFGAEDLAFDPWAYMRDHRALIFLSLGGLACACWMLFLLNVGWQAVVLVIGCIAACLMVGLILDYRRRRRFWNEALDAAQNAEHVAFFFEFVSEPEFLEGALAYQIAEQLIVKSKDEMAALDRDVSATRQYIELWTHEIKAPLAAARLILSHMHGLDVNHLKAELERTESYVEQALYAARSTSLSSDYMIREISLAEVVSEACKMNMHLLVAKGVSVERDISDSLEVFADRTWIVFVLSQVISNSAKYDAATIVFSASVIDKGTSKGHTILEVKDDGCGIPAEDVPRVFDRAFTGIVGRTHGSATGMGLYLVATMCTRMGLGVQLASEEGEGTRVMISFPHDRRRMRSSGEAAR